MAGSTSQRSVATLLAGYRRVRRVHREKLPPPMRVLGDGYARQEFKAWIKATGTTSSQWSEFEAQWRKYCDMLLGVADSPAATSGDIQDATLTHMSKEQQQQLAKLRETILS